MFHLRALSPFGPIFGKELRTTSRRKRTYVLRFVYLGLLLLVLLWAYAITRLMDHGGGVAARTQALNRMGEVFFGFFAGFTIVAMIAIGPILTATAISEERLRKTLPVLLMTPINAWQIVAGKLFSRVWVAITLLGLSLPVLAVVRLLGGVELEQMIAALCICLSTVLFAAALGLFFSTFMNRAYASILLSYAVLLVLYIVLMFIAAAIVFSGMRGGSIGALRWYGTFVVITNPIGTIFQVILGGRAVPGVRPGDWWYCVVSHLSMAALLVMLSAMILRRTARKLAQSGGAAAPVYEPVPFQPAQLPPLPMELPPLPDGTTPAIPTPVPAYMSAPAPITTVKTRPSREVSDNPVLWRELRRPLMARRWQAIVGGIAVVGLLLLTYILLSDVSDIGPRSALMRPEPHAVYAILFCGLITLMVCVLAGTTIAHEKETDTWTLLLATPLSPAAIVWGKVLGLLRRMMWPMVLVVAHLLIFALAGAISFSAALVAIWVIITFNSLFIATGTWLSLRIRKVTFAVILNLLVPIAIYVLVPVVLAILDGLMDRGHGKLTELVLAYMPYWFLGMGIKHLSRNLDYVPSSFNTAPQSFHFEPFGQVTPGEFGVVVLVVGCAYLLLSGLILWHTIATFNRLVGRARQTQPLPLAPQPSPLA